MPTVTYEEHQLDLNPYENLLESLEKAGFEVPCSCHSGVCHGCMAQAIEGQVPAAAQAGLSNNQRRLKYFLTCQCYPDSDLHIKLATNLQDRRKATLIEKRELNQRVLLVRFKAELDWRAGQHVTIWKSETRGRTYSIASSPEDGYIELHMRRRLNGLISHWVEHELMIGSQCQFSQPAGDCYYSPAMPGQDVILIGTGTGLAPLYGILRQALSVGHHGKIILYAAAGEARQLYMVNELRELSANNPDFHYVPVVHRNPDKLSYLTEGDLIDLIPQFHPTLKRCLVYLCGATAMVDQLKELCFLKGAMPGDIFTNTFTPGV